MTERKEPWEVPIMLAVACITKNLHNSAKIHLLNYAEDIWFSGTNLRQSLISAKEIELKGVSEKARDNGLKGKEPFKNLKNAICKIRCQSEHSYKSHKQAAKDLLPDLRILQNRHGASLSYDDDQAKNTMEKWFSLYKKENS